MLNKRIIALLPPIALALFGSFLFMRHTAGIWQTWFFREDSRFFVLGLFSPSDIIGAFLTPMNSMGQYRPITKLFWGLGYWGSGLNPKFCHGITLIMLWLTGATLSRLHFILFGHRTISVFCGALFLLMPANQRPLYWISAWHNTAVALFSLLAIVCRFESAKGKHQNRYRALSLVFIFFALASRELAFCIIPLLMWVDWRVGKIKWSFDLLLLGGAMFLFLFVFHSPLQRAGVELEFDRILRPIEIVNAFRDFAFSAPFSMTDNLKNPFPWFSLSFENSLLIIFPLAWLFSFPLRFTSALCFLSIAPFLFISKISIEYASLLSAGEALLFCGVVANQKWLTRRMPDSAFVILGMCGLGAYYTEQVETRETYQRSYQEPSQMLRKFFDGLHELDTQLPKYKTVHIRDFGRYASGPASISHHFISPAMDEFIPGRIFLYKISVLGVVDGNGSKDPDTWIWYRWAREPSPFLDYRYGEGRFFLW